tara:strand:+ start:40 stop:570 length:531 start_codon:yes stop_codon:yes gene_type:complete
MPETRRIIFSTYVIPTFSIKMEEESITHTEFQTSPGKALGGKGIASIAATQWGDGWTSFNHPGSYWEDQDSFWELGGEAWDGTFSIIVTQTTQQLTTDTSDLAFLYIKNVGDTYSCEVALDETGLSGGGSTNGNYWIIIPPGGSVHLRGTNANFDCNDVYVRSGASRTEVEFIIAK